MNNRWVALLIIFLSFLQLTLNWFNIVPCFGQLIGDMHVTLPEIGSIVGMFILGYGLAHIPGGFINGWLGMYKAMLLGIALQTIGTLITALAPNVEVILFARLLCGIGGSIYIGSAIGVVTAWFRDKELVTAVGMIAGVAFAFGAALGIFFWQDLVVSYGWRHALLSGAGIGLLSFLLILFAFPTPSTGANDVADGHHLNLESLKRVFGNRDLWLIGLCGLGGYGAYFTAIQMLPGYAHQHLGVSMAESALIGTIISLSGIPASFLGGWLFDKVFGAIPTFLGACVVEGAAILLVPYVGPIGIQVCAFFIGGATILWFVGWVSIPGLYESKIRIYDIPTAVGLILTISAVGGVGIPLLYGKIATQYGYTAAWLFMGISVFVTAIVALLVRSPARVAANNGQPSHVVSLTEH